MPARLSVLRRRSVGAVAVAALAVAGASVLPAGSSAAPACRNLTVDNATRTALYNAHGRPRDGQIRKGSVYYGRCGSTRYAIATFSKALADQPEKFRKYPGRGWVDQGDGFENGCGTASRPIPRALVRLWGFCR
ncbi:hypothetical protein DSM112329_01216 [Paraconexibacter sp. AEG42_29]|uniref:Secreted protein n=1 Tax=Paraconexibacter sp. AEG42_29 TaxID=2997339 RepID=A0AAU7ARZ3_9ACTN